MQQGRPAGVDRRPSAGLTGAGETRENRLEQRHTLGRIVGDRSGLERLLDALAQRRRGKLGHDRRQRARGGDERQVQSRKSRRDAQLADRVVEQAR